MYISSKGEPKMKILAIRSALLVLFSVSCCPAATTFALRPLVACGLPNASSPMNVAGDTQKFCLDQRSIVDETDVESAWVTNEQKEWVVVLTLTDEASKRLLEATQRNIGNRIAVVLNARLLVVPLIRGAFSNDIPLGPFTQQQAKDIAAEFNRQAAHH